MDKWEEIDLLLKKLENAVELIGYHATLVTKWNNERISLMKQIDEYKRDALKDPKTCEVEKSVKAVFNHHDPL